MNPVPNDARDLPHRAHQRLIGVLGLLLPPVLYLIAALRPTPPLAPWELLGSISAYYYTGASGILVGVLFALALFLFTYPGYEGFKADRALGRVAGFCALGVSIFPTAAPSALREPPWWRPLHGAVHLASAALLLICFAVFSLWLFRKSAIPERSKRPPDKRRRDAIYLGCGLAIVVSLLWVAVSLLRGAQVFWPEAAALWAFAISWLVKADLIRVR